MCLKEVPYNAGLDCTFQWNRKRTCLGHKHDFSFQPFIYLENKTEKNPLISEGLAYAVWWKIFALILWVPY